jgi:hypothetical protein
MRATNSVERLGSDEHSACIIEAAARVVSIACHLFNELAKGLEDFVVGGLEVNTVGMISQRLMTHPASHRVSGVVSHQKPNAVLY